MNLSSLLSIVNESISLNLFMTRRDIVGNMNVVPKITAKQISPLIREAWHIPDDMNIKNIHVGNKIGCDMTDII